MSWNLQEEFNSSLSIFSSPVPIEDSQIESSAIDFTNDETLSANTNQHDSQVLVVEEPTTTLN